MRWQLTVKFLFSLKSIIAFINVCLG